MLLPFNLLQWIEDHKEQLRPPVGNQVVYKDTDFIVMIVGGPNARKDFHFNRGEEFFYQIKGDMELPIRENGKTKIIRIKEGDVFLLPSGVEHSPQRFPDTIGMVIERKRTSFEMDACTWYCENCDETLYKAEFHCDDIVEQLSKLLNFFYEDERLRTCKKCGSIMAVPELKK